MSLEGTIDQNEFGGPKRKKPETSYLAVVASLFTYPLIVGIPTAASKLIFTWKYTSPIGRVGWGDAILTAQVLGAD
jgi:hypothetical protein